QRTEAEQLKIVLKRSRQETHISQQSGSGTDEGTGSKPGVPDVPSDDSEEELSWNSSDDEDVGGESDEEETRQEEEESIDPIPRTPEESEEESNDEEEQDLKLSEEARIQEEEDADELYRDVMHKDYLLRGSYHGTNSIFLLNCHGVRWQVQLGRVGPYKVPVIRPAWSDFVRRNVDQDIRGLFHLTVVNESGEAVTTSETYSSYVLRNALFYLGRKPAAIVTNRDTQYEFELRWGKVSNSLEIYSSPILRKMKEMTGFMAGQSALFYLAKGTSLNDRVIRLDVC
nr:hypothetical protein [Tanacetum cinerariifolium]